MDGNLWMVDGSLAKGDEQGVVPPQLGLKLPAGYVGRRVLRQ